MDVLKNIAEVVTALTTVIGALIAIEKFSKGALTNWLLKPVLEELKTLSARQVKSEKDILKLIIMSDEMPIEERLDAGERYLMLGGNSQVKTHYKILKENYEKVIREGSERNG